MLKNEDVEPRKFAYDRPSLKFKSFLAKHYNLTKFVQQNNSFVIFDDYFGSQVTNASAHHVMSHNSRYNFNK